MTRQQKLEHYLDELDLTNIALARMAGVAPSSVQRWTAGTIEPPLMLLRLLEVMLLLKRNEDNTAEVLQRWTAEDADAQAIANS